MIRIGWAAHGCRRELAVYRPHDELYPVDFCQPRAELLGPLTHLGPPARVEGRGERGVVEPGDGIGCGPAPASATVCPQKN
jgi:hypothetical protein